MSTNFTDPKIFPPIKEALQALVYGFAEGSKKNGQPISDDVLQEFIGELVTIFSQIDDFERKMNGLDRVFTENKTFAPLNEYCFDLLMINFFISDARELDEDYLESNEWMEIEEKTLDRGTEFMNILLYINESDETDAEMSLDDFLKEFLLTDDDLYQDEYAIYEPVIKNQQLIDGEIKDIVKAGEKITDEEMKEVFVPLLTFFNEAVAPHQKHHNLLEYSTRKPTDVALYASLEAFTQALGELEGDDMDEDEEEE